VQAAALERQQNAQCRPRRVRAKRKERRGVGFSRVAAREQVEHDALEGARRCVLVGGGEHARKGAQAIGPPGGQQVNDFAPRDGGTHVHDGVERELNKAGHRQQDVIFAHAAQQDDEGA